MWLHVVRVVEHLRVLEQHKTRQFSCATRHKATLLPKPMLIHTLPTQHAPLPCSTTASPPRCSLVSQARAAATGASGVHNKAREQTPALIKIIQSSAQMMLATRLPHHTPARSRRVRRGPRAGAAPCGGRRTNGARSTPPSCTGCTRRVGQQNEG